MAFRTADVPDLTGRTAVITGANGGLGLATARALAGAGAAIVMAARDQEKAARAHDEIVAACPDAAVEVVALDLASLASVAEAAAQIRAAHDRLDVLVANAGVMAMPQRRTSDGFEMQLGVNHLGHWALTAQLLVPLLRAPAARIVSVTSTAHHMGRRLDPTNPHLEGRYGPWRAYGQSKLANYHFAVGLQRELVAAGTSAASLLAHPGLANTELQATTVREGGSRSLGGLAHAFSTRLGMSPEDGALPQIRAATDPTARGGELYAPRYVNSGPPVRRPILRRVGLDAAIATLWEVSERETGVALDVAAAAREAAA